MTWRSSIPFFLLAVCLRAQAPDPALGGRLDEKISSALAASGAPSVSVAVVQNKQLVYAKAFGKADLAKDKAADATTRYAIGSVSKQFTAAALLLLEEQGKLSLDDKVAKYFAQLTRAGEITIRELLSHTSGYEDYAPQDYMIPEWTRPTTPQAILKAWAGKRLDFEPGTRWQYSNTNYVVAGEILEKVAGQPLVAFLENRIFRPLGMTSAGDCFAAPNADDATAYTRNAMGPPRPALREGLGWMFAAGELCMTPTDLARWDIAFLEKRILSQQSWAVFTRAVKLKDGKPTHYALGLSIGALDGVAEISHGGEVSGFLAKNELFPGKGVAVAVLSNQDGVSLSGPLADQIARLVFAAGPAPAPAPEGELRRVREVLEGLQQGHIDRALFTSNANSYFTDVALQDYQASLAPLGKLQAVTKRTERLRGGMTHRTYDAQFEKKSVLLNIYVMPGGRFEQFLAVDRI
ncbi:MAG: serine hydrolase domain-containing protein [Bryobacteraceae bacterium]|jgi:CubicO group peptidase (beta-lactamase class C family)